MPDDVLRMRATLVSDETLANLRAIGREIGLMPQKAKRHLASKWRRANLVWDR
jgi:hypothetical protein